MKVIIYEKEYEYVSDYPDGWKFISKDYFKSPVSIGNASLFIKRFPSRKKPLSGLELLRLLKGKNEQYLPRIHDVIDVVEANKPYRYVFTECVTGLTLNKMLEQGLKLDLAKIAIHLLKALQSIHKYDYWFPDFTERNIFAENSGRYLLIDLDSCEPSSTPPDTQLDVSMDYWVPVFKYYKDVLGIQVLPQEFSGKYLNYLQVIFLIQHLHKQTAGGGFRHLSEQEFNALPVELDQTDPAFRQVFSGMLESLGNPDYEVPVHRIEDLILHSVLGKPAADRQHSSLAGDDATDEEMLSPEISHFSVVAQKAGKKIGIVINWEVSDADKIELIKDGIFLKKYSKLTGSDTFTESYDGVNKEVLFEIRASHQGNNEKTASSIVQINDSFAIREAESPTTAITTRFKKPAIIIPAALAALALIWWLIPSRPKRKPILVNKVAPGKVERNFTLVIQGDNFPKRNEPVTVLFNGRPAQLIYSSQHIISAVVPDLGAEADGSRIRVELVSEGDTSLASRDVMFRHR